MSTWIGYAVSVNCGEPLGCYQGTILEADGNTITLTKPFRNGFPYPKSQVTLNAADIKDLKILEEAKSVPLEKSHSSVLVTKNNKKASRATVCENLQANSTNTVAHQNSNVCTKAVSGRSGATPARSKPIDIQNARNKNNNNHTGSYNMSSTPKGGRGGGGGGSSGGGGGGMPHHERARRRNEACFGDTADPAMDDDFDFEGNLALFDKQALWEEMRGVRPDVVRAADEAAMRHDENVLPAPPAPPALSLPPALRAPHTYTTDDGRRLPAGTSRARQLLWEGLRRLRAIDPALVLLGRATADLALRLCGGGRRLEARNAHQAPVVVVAAGNHLGGAAGVLTARLLLSHGVRAYVTLSGMLNPGTACEALQRELAAFTMSGGTAQCDPTDLPAPDVIVLALYDPLRDEGREGHAEALSWARSARSGVLALEPPAAGWGGTCVRASIIGGLPTALDSSLGRLYLANIAPPLRLFQDMHIEFRSPFGAASLLPLN
ncbi:unnamed protein product [Leptosia nina]|uniref:Enhancer of mRNA-decapping protein 3 n=1 Tax=Leptosia nina TaxID=320188 RepID=A0AAV1JPX9_9NEOP